MFDIPVPRLDIECTFSLKLGQYSSCHVCQTATSILHTRNRHRILRESGANYITKENSEPHHPTPLWLCLERTSRLYIPALNTGRRASRRPEPVAPAQRAGAVLGGTNAAAARQPRDAVRPAVEHAAVPAADGDHRG